MTRLLTLHHPGEARGYYASGQWRDDTLYGLAAGHAATRPDGFALRDPARRLNWVQLVMEIDAVAAALHRAGLVVGDRVSVWMSNRIDAVIVFLACSRNGYVFSTSLHQTYTVDEVATLLDRVSSRALFAERDHGADGRAASIFARAADLSIPAVFALDAAQGQDLRGVLGSGAADTVDAMLPAPARDPDAVVYLAFTSGTTGAPKGVMHSANTLLANARAMIADWRQDDRDVLLTLSQMSHHIGTVALTQCLVAGMELVLSAPVRGGDAIDWIERTGASYVMGVPTHAIDILAELHRRDVDRLAAVKTFYLAGAPIPTKTAERLLAMGVTPQNVYGMTENGSHQYTLPGDDARTITATCGRACSAYEICLFDPTAPDNPVAIGQIGEIGGRGAMRMLGYFDNQAATEQAINAHGWFMSGDLGRLDAAGNLEIVGRSKDMIIRGGHNIHPAGIEDLAMRHPRIGKAAAVPVPDDRLGERVCLVVTPQHPDTPAPSHLELLAFLQTGNLSRYDMPEYLAVLGELPLGPTGKVLKREIVRRMLAGEIAFDPVRVASPGVGA